MAEALSTSPLPADISEAIRTVKAQLRSQIGDVAAVFAEVETAMREEATVVAADRAAGRPVWPIVNFPDIAAGTVPAATRTASAVVGAPSCRAPSPVSAQRGGTLHLLVTSTGTGSPRRTARSTTAFLADWPRGTFYLPDLLVRASDRGAPGRQHGRGPAVPEQLLEA